MHWNVPNFVNISFPNACKTCVCDFLINILFIDYKENLMKKLIFKKHKKLNLDLGWNRLQFILSFYQLFGKLMKNWKNVH